MATTQDTFIDGIEKETGLSIDEIRRTPLDDLRSLFERKNGKRMEFVKSFPLIERGSVLGDCVISHAEVEDDFDKALTALRK
ncbi:MAG: hypothetical protein JXR76_22240 [Deltaproteobacteria bacterium]|nr:hypothetical protein [Deltaproteobacteria bacterium]